MSKRRVQAPRAGEQTSRDATHLTMSAGSICSREVDTANYGESVLDAARRMRERQVGALIVVDDMTPVGILTDRDLTVRVLAAGSIRRPHA
jgi:CBS domain-containing protein